MYLIIYTCTTVKKTFFKEMNTFIPQGWSDSKDFYIVKNIISNKCFSFKRSVNQNFEKSKNKYENIIVKKKIIVYTKILSSTTVFNKSAYSNDL